MEQYVIEKYCVLYRKTDMITILRELIAIPSENDK